MVDAAAALAGFAVFLAAVAVLLFAVAGTASVVVPRRRGRREDAEMSATADAMASAMAGLHSAATAGEPLLLARGAAEQLTASMTARLGAGAPAVWWMDEVVRRLGGRDGADGAVLDELGETRVLAALAGCCVRLRDLYYGTGRAPLAFKVASAPLGRLEDHVIGDLRYGAVALTLATGRTVDRPYLR